MWPVESSSAPALNLGERELEDAFAEGMSFLQHYPVLDMGGIELILQTAHDLLMKREAGAAILKAGPTALSTRLRETMRGFAFPTTPLESHQEEDEDSDSDVSDYIEDLQAASATSNGFNTSALTARLADTVWRGITNQSAMDAPSTPSMSSFTPSPVLASQPLPDEPHVHTNGTNGTAPKANPRQSIWGYAEKLRESDAAATFAKVSTNWRVKALDVWHKRTGSGGSVGSLFGSASSVSGNTAEHDRNKSSETRRGSVSESERSDPYSPPPRPAFFRPVRDSFMPLPRKASGSSLASPIASPISDGASHHSHQGSLTSLSITENMKSTSKQGPRPLLLGSSSVVSSPLTRSPTAHSRSPTAGYISPSADRQWADHVRATRSQNSNRGSQSSISSLSPSDPVMVSRRETRSDLDSDTRNSRIVPLNRTSRSPMARVSRRAASVASASSTSFEPIPPLPPLPTHTRTGTVDTAPISRPSSRGWGRVDLPDSPPPRTPDAVPATSTEVRVKAPESQRGSIVLKDSDDCASEIIANDPPKLQRRTATISRRRTGTEETSDSSSAPDQQPRTPRTKAKRVPPRLAGLRTNSKGSTGETPLPKQASLAPEWPDENDPVATPRAMDFDAVMTVSPVSPNGSRRLRKTSGDTISEPRSRKLSTEGREVRTRKVSSESVRSRKPSSERASHKRESAAVEGDDEGYGELLSAYETDDNVI